FTSLFLLSSLSFLFTAPPPTEIYTLSLHDALPISMRKLVKLSLKSEELQAPLLRRPEVDADVAIDLYMVVSEVLRQELSEKFPIDRKSTRLNSSHVKISYAVFCLKKKKK